MKKKSLFALLLAFCLLLGCMTACGSGAASANTPAASSTETNADSSAEVPAEEVQETEASTQPDAESAEAQSEDTSLALEDVELPLFDEPVELTFWTAMPFFMEGYVSDMGKDLYLLSQLQEDCGFTLDVTSVNGMVENEQFNLMVAAGDYTDIMSGVANYPAGYDAAISNGIIIDLMDLVPEYAPNYWYYVNSTKDIRANIISDDGALPTVATIYKETGCENRGFLYRQDWLQNFGMEEPSTYEELHEYIQRCNQEYGSKGLALAGSSMGSVAGAVTQLSYGMDFAIGNYNVIDGTVVYSYLNENLYDYLGLMSAWYADGSIVNEFYNLATDEGDSGIPTGGVCPFEGSYDAAGLSVAGAGDPSGV